MYLQSKFTSIAEKNIAGYRVLLHIKENAKMKVPHRAQRAPPKSRVRTTFDFKKLCFICGLEADVEKEKKKVKILVI